MIEHPNLIPLAAIIAVGIFLAREILEAFRRHRTNSRKLQAIRRFIAVECERNDFAINRLRSQLAGVDEALEAGWEMRVESRQGGSHRLEIKKLGGSFSSSPIPKIHSSAVEKYLFEAASLNSTLFDLMETTLADLVDVAHVRDSFLEYLLEDREHLGGFAEWATGELDGAIDSIRNLYFNCTGEPLAKGRVR